MAVSFVEKLGAAIADNSSLLCVGLDPESAFLGESAPDESRTDGVGGTPRGADCRSRLLL